MTFSGTTKVTVSASSATATQTKWTTVPLMISRRKSVMAPPVSTMSSWVNPVTVAAPWNNTRMIKTPRTVVASVSVPFLLTACSRVSTSSSARVAVAPATFSPVAAPRTVSVSSSSNASSSGTTTLTVPDSALTW